MHGWQSIAKQSSLCQYQHFKLWIIFLISLSIHYSTVGSKSWALQGGGTKHYGGSSTAKNWQGPVLLYSTAAGTHKTKTHKQLFCHIHMQTSNTDTIKQLCANSAMYFRCGGKWRKAKNKREITVHNSSAWLFILAVHLFLCQPLSLQMCICVILANWNSFVTVKNGGLVYGASKPNIENACEGL